MKLGTTLLHFRRPPHASALATIQRSDRARRQLVLRYALGCLAARGGRLDGRMMRKPTGARLTSDAALLLLYGVGLLVCRERSTMTRRPRVPLRSKSSSQPELVDCPLTLRFRDAALAV